MDSPTDLRSKYPDAPDAELEALQKALDSLSGERRERFAEAYDRQRKTLATARNKLRRGGWYGAHYYYLGSGCTAGFYSMTLGLFFVLWAIDMKRGDRMLKRGLEVANLGIINSILPSYQRHEEVFRKYGDDDIAEAIAKETFVKGMTGEMLTESIGRPHSITHQTVEEQNQEVWNYYPQGADRFGLKITFEEGKIIAWDQKNRT